MRSKKFEGRGFLRALVGGEGLKIGGLACWGALITVGADGGMKGEKERDGGEGMTGEYRNAVAGIGDANRGRHIVR
jgi:hypothetical protein